MSRFIALFIYTIWWQVGSAPASLAGPASPESSNLVAATDAAVAIPAAAVTADLTPYLGRAAAGAARDGVAEMKRALTLWRGGNRSAAVTAFERAATLSPGIADWARALGADAAASGGDTATVRRLLGATEPLLAREWGWRSVVTGRRSAGDLAGAIHAALAASESLSEPSRRAEAARTAGELFLVRADTASGLAEYRRAMQMAPLSSAALDAARALGALPSVTAADHAQIGRVYFAHRNVERGMSALDRYLAAGVGSAGDRAAATLAIGQALFDARRYEDAERRLTPLAHETTAVSINAEALLIVGRSQYRLARVDAARVSFAMAAKRFPGERAAAEALYILGDLEHDAGRLPTARSYYRRVINTHAGGEAAGDAAMRLGGIAYSTGDVLEAALVFEEYRSSHRRGKRYTQATYWAGRAYLALGDTALGNARLREARKLEPASHYGMRAADLLAEGAWHTALLASPVTSEATRIETTGALRRLDILSELGLSRASAFEMQRLKQHFGTRDGALYLLAETLHARKEMLAAIRLGREIHRLEGQWNDRLLRIVYPFPYREPIVREAKLRGIDPYLAAGLVRQESLFDPRAISSAGAVGLMQVMPQTGKKLAPKVGLKTVTTGTLRTPDPNIRLGMLYLSDLLKRYGGDVSYMLAAYNAGPSRVARWRMQAEATDPDLFAERIPFDETRDYVKIVQQNARIYRALYGE